MNASCSPAELSGPLLQGQAQVVAVEGDRAWLAAVSPSACGACATRSVCGSGSSRAHGSTEQRWAVPRRLPRHTELLQPGDRVRVGVPQRVLLRAALLAGGLPLLGLLAAALALQPAGDVPAAAAGLAGLLLGAAAARRLLRRGQDALLPVVLGRDTLGTATPGTGVR